jgi:hypothetical protein
MQMKTALLLDGHDYGDAFLGIEENPIKPNKMDSTLPKNREYN